jgi:lipopolysaccharide export system permease protein
VRLSPTFTVYIGRHFLVGFVALFFIFLALVLLFDCVELMRRAATKPEVTFGLVIRLAFLKLPHMAQMLFPFAVLFGAMAAFWRLTRFNELVITRAAGVSAWQFLLPALFLAFGLGALQVAVLNPFASALLARYERMEAVLFKGQKSLLALSQTGLWLRQANARGQSVVHAAQALQHGTDVELRDVLVFSYEGSDRFLERIDAEYARLESGFWHLQKASLVRPERPPQFEQDFWLPTDLTLARIQDSFAPPDTLSFWVLPSFIKTLEEAGFSAIRHRLHWHTLLASPLLMCAMVLIAATFSLRHGRRGGTTAVIAGGAFAGFALYFFSDVVFALGMSDSLPVTLAAWTPTGVAMLLGLAMLLHLEDG